MELDKGQNICCPQICCSKGQSKPWPDPTCEQSAPEVWDKDMNKQHLLKSRAEPQLIILSIVSMQKNLCHVVADTWDLPLDFIESEHDTEILRND